MKSLRKKPLKEAQILERVRDHLRDAVGCTLVEKVHGNLYMAGWPDLYAFRSDWHGWIEVKRPTGRLTPAQVARFTRWSKAGLEVSVATLDSSDTVLYSDWRVWT